MPSWLFVIWSFGINRRQTSGEWEFRTTASVWRRHLSLECGLSKLDFTTEAKDVTGKGAPTLAEAGRGGVDGIGNEKESRSNTLTRNLKATIEQSSQWADDASCLHQQSIPRRVWINARQRDEESFSVQRKTRMKANGSVINTGCSAGPTTVRAPVALSITEYVCTEHGVG